jgi:hypothetical protein
MLRRWLDLLVMTALLTTCGAALYNFALHVI